MKTEEFDIKLKELQAQFEKNKQDLYMTYVHANRKFTVGDILKQHDTILKVEKVGGYMGLGTYPKAVYKGVIYTKKLVPTKKGEWGGIYGDENTEKIG